MHVRVHGQRMCNESLQGKAETLESHISHRTTSLISIAEYQYSKAVQLQLSSPKPSCPTQVSTNTSDKQQHAYVLPLTQVCSVLTTRALFDVEHFRACRVRSLRTTTRFAGQSTPGCRRLRTKVGALNCHYHRMKGCVIKRMPSSGRVSSRGVCPQAVSTLVEPPLRVREAPAPVLRHGDELDESLTGTAHALMLYGYWAHVQCYNCLRQRQRYWEEGCTTLHAIT